MVALPEVQSLTAAAMDAARAASQQTRDGLRLPASGLGNPCDRALWYGFRWVHDPKRFDGRMLRLFADGFLAEAQLLDELRAVAGVTVIDRDERDPDKQIGVSFADGHGWGYLDAEAVGLPEAPVTVHVVEVKTHKADIWRAVKKHGVAAKKPDHHTQMMVYMHVRNRSRALYVYKNKDTSEVETERVDYDLKMATDLMLRAETIVYADRPPARVRDDDGFPCGFCDHRGHCREQLPARRNCRTCLYATPTAGGKWVCDRFEHDLTREAQAQGCPHHLLIPDLVHGRQLDADLAAGWIEYELLDGARWIDRAGSPDGRGAA
jgi:hypothetical protein